MRALLLGVLLVGSAAGQEEAVVDPTLEAAPDAVEAEFAPSSTPRPAVLPAKGADDNADWSTTDLAHLGLTESQGQYATLAALSFWFFARDDEVLTDARVRLRFSARPALYKDIEAVELSLNDEPVATISRSDLLRDREPVVRLDSRLLSARNSLSIQLVGTPSGACEDQVPRGAWRVLEGGEFRPRAGRCPCRTTSPSCRSPSSTPRPTARSRFPWSFRRPPAGRTSRPQ